MLVDLAHHCIAVEHFTTASQPWRFQPLAIFWFSESSWITSRVDAGCAFPQPPDNGFVQSDRRELRKLAGGRVRDTGKVGFVTIALVWEND